MPAQTTSPQTMSPQTMSPQTLAPAADSFGSTARPVARPLTDRLEEIVESWAKSQYDLVTLAAEFADSAEWVLTGFAHGSSLVGDHCRCRALHIPESGSGSAANSKICLRSRTRSKPVRFPTARSEH